MDVVGLAFTVFGHLLASVLYIWRRIPFSSSREAVDRTSILENKEQLRQLWDRRIMADEQHQTQASNLETGEAKESQEKKTVVENGTSAVCIRAEGSEKGDPDIHDISETDCTSSTDHNEKDPLSISEATDVLTNESEPPAETDQITGHVDLLKPGNIAEGKHDQKDISEEEKISEKTENVSCDNLPPAEGGNCLSDDQKVDKIGNDDQNEIARPLEEDIHKSDGLIESEEHISESEAPTEEFSERYVEATLVRDDAESERFDEPTTEAYYTSNFTFVCQKPYEKVEEQPDSEEPDAVSKKMEAQEIAEDECVEESAEIWENENEQPVETSTCDDNANITSVSGPNEVPESSFSEASLSEYSESTEGAAEAGHGSRVSSREYTMTSDFPEPNDKAGNTPESHSAANEKSENESEIDSDVYNKLNNAAEEEKELPSRTGSTTPEGDGDLKAGKMESSSHFVRLKKTGVQKTERPYDSGTTESKIAMEIREMREREEELRQMRERTQSPEGDVSSSNSSPPLLSPTSSKQKSSDGNAGSTESGPGYRVSTVFGHKGSPAQTPVEEEKKIYRSFSKESAVEKEIRIARNREEELRKQKGLPPREDDSYIKPSQVKSAQVRVFGKANASNTSKELATTKIQHEIEEQTLREMALREKGHIQTISQERTDSKVAKLKDLDLSVPECTSPTSPNGHGGSFSDRSSKRSTPSPTGSSHGSIPPVSPRPVVGQGKGISMHKFIASKGKETTFIASRNGPSHPEQNADASRSSPAMRKAKRTVSVESKIQQEILEMKLREEELRRMHNSSTDQPFLTSGENGTDPSAATNDVSDYVNGQEMNGNDESGPPRNNLIAQWEQRIQKAEGKA